ncbi:MAG: hypothetical protein B0D91_03285 [Oceanospirillales bacterium LUC14_002_19_P2]|nr:MAG: hypothetical protein B0D91_03285 [Oceanospirillales bacterium LUC14_002_19_P2]
MMISKELVDSLSELVGCPQDHFTLEHIPSTFIVDGAEDAGYPFVEMLWFAREPEVQDKVASCLTQMIRRVTDDNTDIAVVFHKLVEQDYYENGEHF